MNGHNNGPQSPSKPVTPTASSYDYSDAYEDYETSPEEHPVPNIDFTRTTTLGTSPSTMQSSTTTTMASTTPAAPSSPPVNFVTGSTYAVHLTTKMMPPPLPPAVTSMPLDTTSGAHLLPPVHENFVEVHKQPDIFGGNAVHFPTSGSGLYGRPGSVISILPESTSNVIVPHDQDTVSFVLGNRQNVEGSYYTHSSESAPSPDNFRPIFGSDQKVSVALPSVAVVESTPPKWYKPEGEQQVKPGSSFAFPAEGPQNDAPASGQKDATEVSVSGYVSFPEKPPQDKERPVEEHIIVINQADGSIKEMISPGVGSSGPVDNPIVFGSLNGPNHPNLPQLSESLTPPAEPSR